jgi:hypothetical protein
MPAVIEGITRDVRDIDPYPYGACLRCLAERAGLPEHDVRGAAQGPVLRREVRVVRVVCHWCRGKGNALVIE